MQGSKRDTDVKNRLLDSVGEGEGGMIWENSIETCILPYCKIDDQSKFDAWNSVLKAGELRQPRGMESGGRWKGGLGWGSRVHVRLSHVSVWQNPHNIVK